MLHTLHTVCIQMGVSMLLDLTLQGVWWFLLFKKVCHSSQIGGATVRFCTAEVGVRIGTFGACTDAQTEKLVSTRNIAWWHKLC